MKRVFKNEISYKGWAEIRIIDLENNTFTFYHVDNAIGFPFGVHMHMTITEMGYTSAKDCIKQLKHRKLLGIELDYKEQKEAERLGLLKLGVERIKMHNRVNTKDFEDIIQQLSAYGLNYCDAQEQIIGLYEYELEIA